MFKLFNDHHPGELRWFSLSKPHRRLAITGDCECNVNYISSYVYALDGLAITFKLYTFVGKRKPKCHSFTNLKIAYSVVVVLCLMKLLFQFYLYKT
ncbi:hypothetical protein H8356DRAFT_1343044 [Neocallimastix lanati (nom. inval.)]|nr:hypothetical protein H8356DRAFT_1343044 [Neocallimastix sp. JGI-2020a]